jgi:hypothetical protein
MTPHDAEDAHPVQLVSLGVGQIIMRLHRDWKASRAEGGLAGKLLRAHQPNLPPMEPIQPACTCLRAPPAAPHPLPVIPLSALRRGPLAGRQGPQYTLSFSHGLGLIVFERHDIPLASFSDQGGMAPRATACIQGDRLKEVQPAIGLA